MQIFQPKYPSSVGGKPISFLRIVRSGEICAVAKIIDHLEKIAEVIAKCTITRNFVGTYFFKTEPGEAGHEDLCILLERQGLKGKYRDWLRAVEAGLDQLAEQKSSLAVIAFECDLIDENEASSWTIN
ncbi:hypothetical protein ACFLQZ_02845 [Acidobacteriota bacterium]